MLKLIFNYLINKGAILINALFCMFEMYAFNI